MLQCVVHILNLCFWRDCIHIQGTHLHRVLRPICVVDLYHTIGGGIVPRSEENKSPMMHIYINDFTVIL